MATITNKLQNATEGGDKPSSFSPLIKKVIKLRPVPIRKPVKIISNNPNISISENTMLTGTSFSIICPINNKGMYEDPLTRQEREYFENLLGINLDVNKPKDNHYNKARLTVYKIQGELANTYLELDLSDPYQFILYKIACISPEIANQKMPLYRSGILGYLDDEEVALDVAIKQNNIEDEVIEYLLSIKQSRSKLLELLEVYLLTFKISKIIDYNWGQEKLYTELKDITRDKETLNKLHMVIDEYKTDVTKFNLNLLIRKALLKGEMIYNGVSYKTNTGVEMGKDLATTRAFLQSPENQDFRERIEKLTKI